jgi:hypothetical protein
MITPMPSRFTEDKLKEMARVYVDEYLNHPFNKDWYLEESEHDEFKSYFIRLMIHQCSPNMHPLTHGSAHGSLMIRRSFHMNYLVCPVCGWIQLNPPIIVNPE